MGPKSFLNQPQCCTWGWDGLAGGDPAPCVAVAKDAAHLGTESGCQRQLVAALTEGSVEWWRRLLMEWAALWASAAQCVLCLGSSECQARFS